MKEVFPTLLSPIITTLKRFDLRSALPGLPTKTKMSGQTRYFQLLMYTFPPIIDNLLWHWSPSYPLRGFDSLDPGRFQHYKVWLKSCRCGTDSQTHFKLHDIYSVNEPHLRLCKVEAVSFQNFTSPNGSWELSICCAWISIIHLNCENLFLKYSTLVTLTPLYTWKLLYTEFPTFSIVYFTIQYFTCKVKLAKRRKVHVLPIHVFMYQGIINPPVITRL